MGETTDKITGRTKQAAGALTGDEKIKREGERDERKGEIKETLGDAVDKAGDALGDLKKKVSRS